jgi:hypothetical protein
LGHPRAPSLEAAVLNVSLPLEKRGFFASVLSVIAAVLPSEKRLKPPGTPLSCEKTLVFIALHGIPVQK